MTRGVVAHQRGRRRRRAPRFDGDDDRTCRPASGRPTASTVEAGWPAVAFDADYGGGGFPWVVGIALQEMLNSANMALAMAPLLTQGAIDALALHGTEEQREVYLERMVTGEWTGTMNLTEPEAGSDVGALRTEGRAARTTAATASPGRRSSSPSASTTSPTTSSTSSWPAPRTRRRAPRASRCFIVPKFLVDDDGTLGRAQRREGRLDRAQDGHQGQPHLRAGLRRRRRRRGRLPHRRGATPACGTCSR